MNNSHPRRSDSHESGVVQRVRKSLRHIPADRPHVLLACSGGKDSVALASILADLARLTCLSLTIAHIHHGQHDRADDAAAAVEATGRSLDVPVIIRHLSPVAIASHSGVGMEEALRRERYLALADVAAAVHADCIALAHHQSDQAETLLLHLLRGSGVDGLAGMREWEHRDIPWWHGPVNSRIGIWRPFLHEAAQTVADMATQSGLPIVEDPTNTDTSLRRNAVRHDVLPVLERISPGSTSAIARAGEVIAVDAGLLAEATNIHLASCRSRDGLSRNSLIGLAQGWQLRVVRAWLLQASIVADITHNRVAAIVELAQRNRGGSRVEMGESVVIVLRRGELTIESVAE